MATTPRLAALLAVLAVAAALTAPAPVRAQEDVGGLTVFAGTGEEGFSGDGGPAADAMLKLPLGVAVAPDGTVYISDLGNHRVRAVAPDGTISTVVGSGRRGTHAAVLTSGARGGDIDLALPRSLAVGPDGTLYVADAGLLQVFALAPDGRLSVLAGTGRPGPPGDGGPATSASLGQLGGLAVGPDGTVYIGDLKPSRLRAVSPDGTITTVAGNGGERFAAAGGDALAAPVLPYGLAVDAGGAVWIAAAGWVQRVSGGRLTTVVHPGEALDRWALSEEAGWPPSKPPMGSIGGVSVAGGHVYVYSLPSPGAVLRLDTGHVLSKVAELHPLDDRPNGPMAVTASGVAYLVDYISNRVYSIRLTEPVPPAPSGGGSVPWWPFVAAGAVVVTFGGWWAVRRRRIG